MYKHNERQMIMPEDFYLPFGGKLNPNNRWCRLAAIIPWAEVEDRYAREFKEGDGQQAFSVRVALGALIIQTRKSLSDRELVQEISENPYLQYFLGFSAFSDEPRFNPTMMVHFRKRLGKDIINEINELIAVEAAKTKGDDQDRHGGGGKASETKKKTVVQEELSDNQGTLLLDATCAPADIHYPTDLWLLNETREALEKIIDVLHEPHTGQSKKPRTYRQKARKSYLNVDKKKHKTAKAIRKGIGKQLRYIKRDLRIIETMSRESPLSLLSNRQYQDLLVCQEIYRQQREMYQNRTHKIEDRIVSLHMPYVRPIVRGKASANVEFGAKVAISTVNGFCFMEHVSFDAFNEGTTLIQAVNNYHRRFGFYPRAVIADKIYRNRENISFCKSLGIRLSGPPLGRPAKDPDILKDQRREERQDAKIRNQIEAAFGEGKRIYGLGRIMARLRETSETVISMQLLVMNLERRLRILFAHFLKTYFLRFYALNVEN